MHKLGFVAYKLDLPSSSKIHLFFRVSCLKKKIGQKVVPLPMLPPTDSSGQLQLEPKKILGRRIQKKGNHAMTEVLVS